MHTHLLSNLSDFIPRQTVYRSILQNISDNKKLGQERLFFLALFSETMDICMMNFIPNGSNQFTMVSLLVQIQFNIIVKSEVL